MLVIVLVLAAAAVGALGLVLLRKATQAEPERPQFSLKLLWLLIRRRPVWAGGIVTLAASFVLQGIALANGPVSQVQLVIVLELPFSLIMSRLVLGGRLRAREWSAIVAMTLGVAVVLLTLSPTGGDPNSVNLLTWLLGLGLDDCSDRRGPRGRSAHPTPRAQHRTRRNRGRGGIRFYRNPAKGGDGRNERRVPGGCRYLADLGVPRRRRRRLLPAAERFGRPGGWSPPSPASRSPTRWSRACGVSDSFTSRCAPGRGCSARA